MNSCPDEASYVRMSTPRAAAWSRAIALYWQALATHDELDLSAPVDVVGLTSDCGEFVSTMLPALQDEVSRLLLPDLRVRLLPCFEDSTSLFAWRSYRHDREPSDSCRVEPLLWRLGDASPRDIDARETAWRSRNPVVVLVHDMLHRPAQRLLALHYGKLLEADLDRLGSKRVTQAEQVVWLPAPAAALADMPVGLLPEYGHTFNSVPLSLSRVAQALPAQLRDWAPQGFLALCEARGVAERGALRLLGVDPFIERYRRDGTLPLNFEMLRRRWHEAGALAWEREVNGGRVVQVAVGGARARAECLSRVAQTLSDADHGDASDLVDAMRAVADRHGETAILALLRRAALDKQVFVAACPALHARRMASGVTDPPAWQDALRAVAAQCSAHPRDVPVWRAVGHCAMKLRDWPLATEAFSVLTRANRPAADDVVGLAMCHARTGQLRRAVALARRACKLAPDDERPREFFRQLAGRLARDSDPWRRFIAPAGAPIVLEPLHAFHFEELQVQYRDPQIAAMTALPGLPGSSADAAWFNDQFLAAGRKDFAVVHACDGYAGQVSMEPEGDIGYVSFWIGADHQGKGYSQLAVRALVDFAWSLGTRIIITSAYDDNLRSIRVLKRMGFQRIAVRCTGNMHRRTFFALLPPDGPSIDPVSTLFRFHEAKDLNVDFEAEVVNARALSEIAS